jgi:opacity protein-like surface antigen
LKRSLFAAAVAGIALAALPFAAQAQSTVAKPVQFGVSGGAAIPTSDLADFTNTGFNVAGHVGFNPSLVPVGIRVDGAYNRWGYKQQGIGGDVHSWNVTGNALYKIPSASMSPYLLAGAGWYQLAMNVTGAGNATENDFGWNVGGGISIPLSGFDTFIEAKYTQIQTDGTSAKFVPITFGIMF